MMSLKKPVIKRVILGDSLVLLLALYFLIALSKSWNKYWGEGNVFLTSKWRLSKYILSINENKSKINELCDDAKLYFEGDVENIEKKWKSLNKIFNDKNLSRKDCILLPFKTLKKIVSK